MFFSQTANTFVLHSPYLILQIVIKNLSNEKVNRVGFSGVDQFFYAGTGNLLIRDSNGISLCDVINKRTLATLKNTKVKYCLRYLNFPHIRTRGAICVLDPGEIYLVI